MYKHMAVETIDRPIEEVFAYVSDVSKQPEWTHFLMECKLQGEKPIGEGSVAIQTMKMMGRTQNVELHIVEFEANRRIRFEKHEPFYITFGFVVEPKESSTQLTYSVEMKPSGLFRLFIPLIARKENERDMLNIKSQIESNA